MLKIFFAVFFTIGQLLAQTITYDSLEKVNVGIDGYILGKKLNKEQKDIAKKNLQKANVAKTYKFRDNNTYVVADSENDRVILMYKPFNNINNDDLKSIVSDLIATYEEPTTTTHNNIIYWFYKDNGSKVTLDEFIAFRDNTKIATKKVLTDLLKESEKKSSELGHVLTVKLSSTKPIFSKDRYLDGSAYLMISSEQLIKENYNINRH